jgi:hypothetical protein
VAIFIQRPRIGSYEVPCTQTERLVSEVVPYHIIHIPVSVVVYAIQVISVQRTVSIQVLKRVSPKLSVKGR